MSLLNLNFLLIVIVQIIQIFQVENCETTGQRPNESQKALIIDVKDSVGEIASKIWPVLLFFIHFFQKGQGYRHLGHWMLLIGLYLGIKCEVCRWNRICDMTSCLVFVYFWEDMTLTFDLDRRSSTFGSLNAPDWVVPWYQVRSLLVK